MIIGVVLHTLVFYRERESVDALFLRRGVVVFDDDDDDFDERVLLLLLLL